MRRFQLQMIDGKELINFEWLPSQKPIAIVQIVHNIDEHMSLYNDIAKILNDYQILVLGTDLRGCGESAVENGERGYFSKNQGWNNVIEDLRTVNTFIRRKYPDLPIFMLGQTIGGDISLAYAIKYCETINGLILSGTKNNSTSKILPELLKGFIASFIINKWPRNYFFAKLDKPFETKKSIKVKNTWISSDAEFVRHFNNDKLSLSWMTNKANKDILEGKFFVSKTKNLDMIDKDFPIIIMTGDQDAYTKFAKNSRRLFSKFIKLGSNVDFKIYKGSRNRILNDFDKKQVIKDIVTFVKNNLN